MRELERRSRMHRGALVLNQGELSKMLHGEYAEPSWRVVRATAEVLGVDPEWLMHDKGAGPDVPYGVGNPPPWPGPRPSALRDKAPPTGVRRKRKLA